jgi:steroid 5-alpha reductase family enzyme
MLRTVNRAETQAAAAIPLIVAIGVATAWAGSQGGIRAGGIAAFAICAMLSFGINWLVFIHAYLRQTERFYDLTGSLTYLTLVSVAVGLRGSLDPRALLLAVLVAAWAVRLGSFLFIRVTRDGGDGRFDEIKPSLPRFAMFWTLQALWVLLTAACALAALTSAHTQPLGVFAALGTALWVAGMAIEVMADEQKRRFRADPGNRERFIQSGIWAWSRHPNYFGEILLWVGIAVIAWPALTGWQHATLISPVFVYLLLTRISGIPMLESRGKRRWGDDPAYRDYKKRTPALFPKPPSASA